MQSIHIVVADAARARIFHYDRGTLVEVADLVDPPRRHLNDDRERYRHHLDAAFARTVAQSLAARMHATNSHRAVLCAGPRMLGFLRTAVQDLRAEPGVVIEEIARNLVAATPTELHVLLDTYGVLPVHERRNWLAAEPLSTESNRR